MKGKKQKCYFCGSRRGKIKVLEVTNDYSNTWKNHFSCPACRERIPETSGER